MNILPDLEIQKKICDLISYNPGLHISKIAELLNKKIPEIEYQLQYLCNSRILIVQKEDGVKRYYLKKPRIKARERRTRKTRRMIYNLITQNPGLYLSKIAEKLNMSIPLTDYHLGCMQKDGRISIKQDAKGYSKRYYITESNIQSKEKKFLEFLRKKIPLKIVLLLLKHRTLQHKDIKRHLDMHASSLTYHLVNLEESGIIDVQSFGREKGYTLTDPDEIMRIMKKYELQVEPQLEIEEKKDTWNNIKDKDTFE